MSRLLLLLLVLAPSVAQGMTPGLLAQRFAPAPGPGGFTIVEVAQVLPAGHPAMQAALSYGHRPAATANGGLERQGGLVDGVFATHVRLALGLASFIEIGVSAPLLQFVAAGDQLPGVVPGARASSGDVEIAGRFRILREDQAVGVVVSPFVTLPTGRRLLLLTRGVPTLGARLAVSGTWEPIRAAVNVGYRFVPSGYEHHGAVSDDELMFGAAVGVTPPGVPLVVAIEATGAVVVGGKRADALAAGAPPATLAPGELIGSGRVRLPAGFAVFFGGGAGLAPALGVPQVRAFVGVDWIGGTPVPGLAAGQASDVDGDGVPDASDLCPSGIENINGFEDDDGCPEGDTILVRGDRIVVLEPIRYAGVTRLADSATPVLEQLAAFLNAHPEFELVRIEGHTSADDKEMSRMRAVQVMLKLVESGVEPERLEAVGFGASKPAPDGPRDRILFRIQAMTGQ